MWHLRASDTINWQAEEVGMFKKKKSGFEGFLGAALSLDASWPALVDLVKDEVSNWTEGTSSLVQGISPEVVAGAALLFAGGVYFEKKKRDGISKIEQERKISESAARRAAAKIESDLRKTKDELNELRRKIEVQTNAKDEEIQSAFQRIDFIDYWKLKDPQVFSGFESNSKVELVLNPRDPYAFLQEEENPVGYFSELYPLPRRFGNSK